MVSREISKGSSLKLRKRIWWYILLFVSVAVATVFVVRKIVDEPDKITDPVEMPSEISEQEEIEDIEPEIPKIDFQTIVENWAADLSGNKSVVIYDLDRDEVAARYNSEEKYNTASLYKLFVVYEGYRRLQSGEWNAETGAGYTSQTILKCLDLAIRESNSPCAETLWGMIDHTKLDEIIKNDFKIENSQISLLESDAEDITKMMKIFYDHSEITNESLISVMKDSFLNQPKTTYNWRQGLPSGFSDAVNVYNKVGWDYNPNGGYWNIYHDTAIVEFPALNRHFIVTVMTNYIDFKNIARLGSLIETAVNNY